MNLETIMQLLQEEEQLRPVIKQMLKTIQNYGPELELFIENISIGLARIKTKQINEFKANGFTHEEAILLTMDEWYAISKRLSQNNKVK